MVVVGVMLALVCGGASPVAALPVPPVPAGLQPGDQYQLTFVTLGTRDATSTNIADYNTFVTQEAAASTVYDLTGISWKAIGDTATVKATNNAPATAAVYRLDGVKVADAGFFYTGERQAGDHVALMNVNQNLHAYVNGEGPGIGGGGLGGWAHANDAYVWTGMGTYPNGPPAVDFLGTTNPDYGHADADAMIDTFDDWVVGNTKVLPFYALSGVLTVVPEPSTMALSFGAMLGLLAYAWRKRR
jgi:hypothetical protein